MYTSPSHSFVSKQALASLALVTLSFSALAAEEPISKDEYQIGKRAICAANGKPSNTAQEMTACEAFIAANQKSLSLKEGAIAIGAVCRQRHAGDRDIAKGTRICSEDLIAQYKVNVPNVATPTMDFGSMLGACAKGAGSVVLWHGLVWVAAIAGEATGFCFGGCVTAATIYTTTSAIPEMTFACAAGAAIHTARVAGANAGAPLATAKP